MARVHENLREHAEPIPARPRGRNVATKRWQPGAGAKRRCVVCGETLALENFGHNHTSCLVCLSNARQARPWTDEQRERLTAAARGMLNIWVWHAEMWTEQELALWRELLLSVERLTRQDHG